MRTTSKTCLALIGALLIAAAGAPAAAQNYPSGPVKLLVRESINQLAQLLACRRHCSSPILHMSSLRRRSNCISSGSR